MCSFLFILDFIGSITNEQLQKANKIMKSRGPDSTNAIKIKNMYFLHNLLSICGGAIEQPAVVETIVLLFNGEIYNYKELCPDAKSDTDALIKLYLNHGTDFVSMLDGEYAFVIYDKLSNKLIYSTDVFMTKPLFISKSHEKHLMIATYASAIQALGIEAIMAKPNNITTIDLETFEIVEKEVFSFDLNQYKSTVNDWIKTFEEAVVKRAKHGRGKMFLNLSSGYDSGAIALALHKNNIIFDTFTCMNGENQLVLQKRLDIIIGKKTVIDSIGFNENQAQGKMIKENCEDFTYVHFDMPNVRTKMCDDGGARALNYIAKKQSKLGYRVVLSGSGADEIISDYGFNGKKIYSHSQFGGLWPNSLESIFPWNKFYNDTQRSYLFKDEYITGAYGIEGRYPFLDKFVVQEYIWLLPSLKNKEYKYPIYEYLQKNNYPIDINSKCGFSI